MATYPGKGEVLLKVFKAQDIDSLVWNIMSEFENNPMMGLAKIRNAMETHSRERAKAALKEGRLI